MIDENKKLTETKLRRKIRAVGLLIWLSAVTDLYVAGSGMMALRYGVPAGLGQSVPLAAASAAGYGIEGLFLLLVGWHGMTNPDCPTRKRGPISEGSLAVLLELLLQPFLIFRAMKNGKNMIVVLSFAMIKLLLPITYRSLRAKIVDLVCRKKPLRTRKPVN